MEPREKELLDILVNYDTGRLIRAFDNMSDGHADYVSKLQELSNIASGSEAIAFLAKVKIAAEERLIDYFVHETYGRFRNNVLNVIDESPARMRVNAYIESDLLSWLKEQYEHPENLTKMHKNEYGGDDRCAALVFPEKLHRLARILVEMVSSDRLPLSKETADFLALLDTDIKNDSGNYGKARDLDWRYVDFRYSTKNEMDRLPATLKERIAAQMDTQTLDGKRDPRSSNAAATVPPAPGRPNVQKN